MNMFYLFLLLVLNLVITKSEKIIAVTVATDQNDALKRYTESAELNGFKVEVFGLDQEWSGGDLESGLGGGQKINILKKELAKYKDDTETILLFTDAYDVVINENAESILNKYKNLKHSIIFGAEDFCWPNKELADSYPEVSKDSKRFLNSGGFIGRADLVYKMVSAKEIEDTYDDQLYYTEIYLNEKLRQEFDMALDTETVLFMNLNGALSEVTIRYENGSGVLYNVRTQHTPGIIHANGPVKVEFNNIANYLTRNWNPEDGCLVCKRNLLNIRENLPRIQVAIHLERPVPFVNEFFFKFSQLTYPKNLIDLIIYSPTETHGSAVRNFAEKYKLSYKTIEVVTDNLKGDLMMKYENFFEKCLNDRECKYSVILEGVAHLTNPNTIQELIKYNKSVTGPKLSRRGKLWSNFWGALAKDGYYARSDDYVEIVERSKLGLWNVPYMTGLLVIKRSALKLIQPEVKKSILNGTRTIPNDMELCRILRKTNTFLYVDNTEEYGYLTNDDNVTTEHLNNDLWQIFDNPLDWEEKYIHKDYSKFSGEGFEMKDFPQPCPDVFWFPVLSETFCDEIVDEMEFFGEWSNGSNNDTRLEGGYENVPTRDIHMRQINWEPHWLHVLKKYIKPIQIKVFEGHFDEPWARMNFIVRYKPDEQPSLRPHHDASTYTLNIALNNAGKDYQGGGAHFLRYKCAVKDTKKGWALIHPGRVTHIHEGLPTTNGTRYIFVVFVNP